MLAALVIGLLNDKHADIPSCLSRAGAAIAPFSLVSNRAALGTSARKSFPELPRAPHALGGPAILCINYQVATRKSK
jgi:hypothetical protein